MLSVMNSLNIVSRLTATPPSSPPRSRTASNAQNYDPASSSTEGFGSIDETLHLPGKDGEEEVKREEDANFKLEDEAFLDEKTPLLSAPDTATSKDTSRSWSIPKRIAHALLRGVQVVITTLAAPGRYVLACFYDEQGSFSAILPLRNFRTLLSRDRRRRSTAQAVGLSSAPGSTVEEKDDGGERVRRAPSSKRSASVDSTASSSTLASSDGEVDNGGEGREDSPARHTRSRTAAAAAVAADPTASSTRRIKIQPQTDESLRKRRAAKAAAAARSTRASNSSASPDDISAVASALKSPTSTNLPSSSKLTRYPRAPGPPRPLVPRRQPSYTLQYAAPDSPSTPRKTLIIDLDETLIHSMAKGGRMSTGHMVEVRLNQNIPVAPPPGSPPGAVPATLNPGVPILYYVHERPNCHAFLRKVAKWYNLVIFTASVQEYADPVIDWLERERRYFSRRFYRQHCTLRGGAYIKDLAMVEPDLSRVLILDNSPTSYLFHEDNSIPIEGWISDPTDDDLIHLIPLLEGLQYVTDVRALLALRQGQAPQA